MRLSLLYETVGTGAVAIRPAALNPSKRRNAPSTKRDNDDRWYLKFSKTPNARINESEYATSSHGVSKVR